MIHPCDKLCGNKTPNGYCSTTACINPQYSSIGTVQYGQGVQKHIITNADRIRSLSDEKLAKLFGQIENSAINYDQLGSDGWLDWLRQEVSD